MERLGSVESIEFVESSLANKGASRSTARFDVHLVYERKIDRSAECARLHKELDGYTKAIESKEKQLSNERFLSKAPAKVVEGLRSGLQELLVLRDKAQAKINELGCG